MIKNWRNYISSEQWNDWTWQIQHSVNSIDQVLDLFPNIEMDEDVYSVCKKYPIRITPYYASIIDTENINCPIRMQAIPQHQELLTYPEESKDSLAEHRDSPVPLIVHRYPDRVLFMISDQCSMYCRHCTRKAYVGQECGKINPEQIENAINYIRNNSSIRDVLLSGGDALIQTDNYIESILNEIRKIDHIDIVRIGTRTPVVLPMRITDNLLDILKEYKPIWINMQFNHSKEFTDSSEECLSKLSDAGIPLGNQTVLLKGINDTADEMKKLSYKLMRNRVRPYYLYQCDLSEGTHHFRTSIETGIKIIDNLQGYISGMAVPKYVIDAPGGGGKIPISPQYLIGKEDKIVKLRNYENKLYYYIEP